MMFLNVQKKSKVVSQHFFFKIDEYIDSPTKFCFMKFAKGLYKLTNINVL